MTVSYPVSESTWTQRRPDCPHPEWWTSTDDQSTEREVSELVAGFVRALQPDYVVETGTYLGQTANIVGRALALNGHGRLDTVEPDPRRADLARRRCEGLPVTVHEVESLQFEPAAQIGFAWLDSRLNLRIRELEHFRPWFAPGAIVGVHDTGPQHGTLGARVEALDGIRPIRLRTPRGVMFAEVL